MDKGKVFESLLKLCRARELKVLFARTDGFNGVLKKDRIAINNDLDIESVNYILAHEIAHYYLHYDKGDIITNHDDSYEEQADRAARLLLDSIKTCNEDCVRNIVTSE